jgi:chorismate mutase/prephenate dehydratase
MSEEEKLKAIRARIDALDEQIQALISERAAAAQDVARVKLSNDRNAVFYRPEREAAILHRVIKHNRGPMSDQTMALLFREIMSACLALEQPLKVAFLGPEGTFTQAAAFKHFGHAVRTQPLGSIDEVFRTVERGLAQYGVVPIENSTEGVINHTLDMFLGSPLRICGEVELRIHHCVMSTGEDVDDITRVYSHHQSLAQCRDWLDRNLPGADRLEVSSNAEAARLAGGMKDKAVAAVAGEAAAEIYGLRVLARNIEDQPDNTTRFLVVGKQPVPPTGQDKSTLMISAPNRSGALYRLLEPFAGCGISLTRIESRPSRRETWEYVFFVDLEGHVDDEPVVQALAALETAGAMVKVLGSYPRAIVR